MLLKFDELTLDEYAYLLPLCTNADYTKEIIEAIKDYRAGKTTIDEIIISRIYEMDIICAGEEFHAAMKRSTNGGGENSPMLAGEDDFYELFMANLK